MPDADANTLMTNTNGSDYYSERARVMAMATNVPTGGIVEFMGGRWRAVTDGAFILCTAGSQERLSSLRKIERWGLRGTVEKILDGCACLPHGVVPTYYLRGAFGEPTPPPDCPECGGGRRRNGIFLRCPTCHGGGKNYDAITGTVAIGDAVFNRSIVAPWAWRLGPGIAKVWLGGENQPSMFEYMTSILVVRPLNGSGIPAHEKKFEIQANATRPTQLTIYPPAMQ